MGAALYTQYQPTSTEIYSSTFVNNSVSDPSPPFGDAAASSVDGPANLKDSIFVGGSGPGPSCADTSDIGHNLADPAELHRA